MLQLKRNCYLPQLNSDKRPQYCSKLFANYSLQRYTMLDYPCISNTLPAQTLLFKISLVQSYTPSAQDLALQHQGPL